MSDFKIKESRRSFVKKVGTGALLTSLPAQSVWGACNASGVSGGSRVVDVTCDSPPTISIGGWSPGQWQKYVDDFASVSGGSATYSSKSLCIVKMFEDFPTPTGGCSEYKYLEYYHNEVKSLLNINIELGGGHLFDSFSFNPYDAFAGTNHSESRKDWSACYMNLLLGFWTWDTNEFSDPIDVLNGLWVYFSVTDGGQDSTGKYVGSPGSIVSFATPKYTESKVSVNDVKGELGGANADLPLMTYQFNKNLTIRILPDLSGIIYFNKVDFSTNILSDPVINELYSYGIRAELFREDVMQLMQDENSSELLARLLDWGLIE